MTAESATAYPGKEGSDRPLCVDLDGVLLLGDPVWETWFALLRQHPMRALRALGRVLLGRRRFAEYLCSATDVEPERFAFNDPLIDRLRRAKAAGRNLVLATALPLPWANALAAHIGLFETVLASDGGVGRPEADKSRVLRERYGEKAFDYVGGGDLQVWAVAKSGWVVADRTSVARAAGRLAHVEEVIQRDTGSWKLWLRQIRLHQWLKNLLVFVPLVAGRRLGDRTAVDATVMAFLAFGCIASGNYILNDLLDLHHDRHHPRKRFRPLASGHLSMKSAVLAMMALFAIGAFLASFLPVTFADVLLLYLAGTLAYSLRLKRSAPLDTFTLAGLYTLRVFAGNAATRLAPSFWLLAFSIFLFLSLAMAKRHAELMHVGTKGDMAARGRGYLAVDREMVGQLGVGAGYISVLVLALYLNSPQAALLYSRPGVLWLLCLLLLYWITRLWLIAHRGQLDDDPVVFAIRDRISRCTAAVAVVLLWFAR